jgi:DNA-binding IclR family transcriptional regulator
MSDFKPRAGTFLPFLEATQRDKPAMSAPPSLASPVTLLEILGRQVQQALPMDDLQKLSGMESSQYRESLRSLRDAGYVAIDGDPLAEIVKLTDRGVEVSRLARPA